MKKVSKKYIDTMKSRGKTVTTKSVPKEVRQEIKKVNDDVPMASMSAAILQIAVENKKTIKSFAEEVKKITGRKRKPWKFTVNRNKQGTITTVLADPVE